MLIGTILLSMICISLMGIDLYLISNSMKHFNKKDWKSLKKNCKIMSAVSILLTISVVLIAFLHELMKTIPAPILIIIFKVVNSIWAFVIASATMIIVFWIVANNGEKKS